MCGTMLVSLYTVYAGCSSFFDEKVGHWLRVGPLGCCGKSGIVLCILEQGPALNNFTATDLLLRARPPTLETVSYIDEHILSHPSIFALRNLACHPLSCVFA
eukprot:4139824-Amphidinium_carterae.1